MPSSPTPAAREARCPYCQAVMRVSRMTCDACQVAVEARFPASRLAALPVEHQRFIEMFVLASGSLKEIAETAGVSYPTVRSRLDRVIAALREEIVRSAKERGETGDDLRPEQAARTIKAI